ncbi:tripartite tricarboxylate transporter TctB family protein [Rhizobium herbae]|uniref:Tricarboxylic transport membrane protein n=1 Tax=Rhizobium herbae TaxID=508661 RepID=A0ABS4EL18_9HYPH|nr:tripartite tricarboxylate transporter TctB family protein [Rhizobium herbae]MBP1858634.1 putative tricarboxylic transport membrane protein [Rhizobium herbae]
MSKGHAPSTEKRRPDRAALFIAVFLAALGGLIFWDTSRLAGAGGYSGVGPATIPFVIASGLLLLAAWTVFEALRGDFPVRERQEVGPVIWIIGGLAAQMLLLKPLGFSIATGLLFAATAAGFGKRKLWFTIPIGIAICLGVWLIFAGLLQLSLPAGPLEHLFW